jgi:hypothetical protein
MFLPAELCVYIHSIVFVPHYVLSLNVLFRGVMCTEDERRS